MQSKFIQTAGTNLIEGESHSLSIGACLKYFCRLLGNENRPAAQTREYTEMIQAGK